MMNTATPLSEIASRTPAAVRSEMAAFLPTLPVSDFVKLNWKAVSAAADAIRYEETRRHRFVEHGLHAERARRRQAKREAAEQ